MKCEPLRTRNRPMDDPQSRASRTCRPARGGHAREEVGGACGRPGADRHLCAKKGGNVTDELKGQHKCLRKRLRYKIHIRKEVRFRPKQRFIHSQYNGKFWALRLFST
ncbi:U7 Snrna-Associated Sm-Like Protein Lsm11 [Manis pentadactyla]|nr:U7 Snrna-Associated Sm-Like Protein Lsm11 [Manis pentadactyla]